MGMRYLSDRHRRRLASDDSSAPQTDRDDERGMDSIEDIGGETDTWQQPQSGLGAPGAGSGSGLGSSTGTGTGYGLGSTGTGTGLAGPSSAGASTDSDDDLLTPGTTTPGGTTPSRF